MLKRLFYSLLIGFALLFLFVIVAPNWQNILADWGNTVDEGSQINAYPVTGTAPLNVTFRLPQLFLHPVPDGGSYKLDYGDGRTTADDEKDACHGDYCDQSPHFDYKNPDQSHSYIFHTYAKPGNYTAKLLFKGGCRIGCDSASEKLVETTEIIVH